MPWREEDKYVQYHDGQKQFKVPFIMYADSESILEPMEKNSKGSPNDELTNMFHQDLVYTAKFAYGGCSRSTKNY